MYIKILETIKVVCLCLIVWIVYDGVQAIKRDADLALQITQQTSQETLNQVSEIRKDTFVFLDQTTSRIDKRISSIQTDLFNRIDDIEINVYSKVDDIGNSLDQNLDRTNSTIEKLAEDYSKIPNGIEKIALRFDDQTNCQINELCWQNMTSDLLIDTRNVMRDGSQTFRTINVTIPSIIADSKTVSDSIAESLPTITENVKKTSDHIEQITKPTWYDRLIKYIIGGSQIYFYTVK